MASSDQTVLIVEDVPYLLELASLFLGRTARVVTAGGGEEGLDKAWREQPDLILCDDNMPGLNGAEVFNRLRAVRPSIPFVFCSGNGLTPEIAASLSHERTDLVMKPYSIEEILGAVRKAVGS